MGYSVLARLRRADTVTAAETRAEERRLLEAARQDPERFAPLYERYYARVYAYCLRRVGPAEAEDLTSLIFIRALAGLADYRGGTVGTWLFRIAHHAVANHLRDRRPQASLDQTWGDAGLLAAGEDPPAEQVIERERRQRLAALVAALPEAQRELLALRLAAGLSAREIGAILGKREGAVRVAIHRIVQQLRTAYGPVDEGRR